MAGSYDINDSVRLRAIFKDFVTKTNVDPTNLTFKFKYPDGTKISYIYGTNPELVRESTGVYYVIMDVTNSGLYFYRFEASGLFRSAAESKFLVKPSVF